MNLNLLPVFLAAARAGSVRGAAERLHCVQSNVSARLRQLEGELGTTLFRRGRSGLVLTDAGRSFLPRAEEILRLAGAAWEEARGRGEPAGELRLGAMECTASARLPDALLAFSARCPRVVLRLTTGATRPLTALTAAGELDAALVAGPAPSPTFHSEPVFAEELVLIASAAAPWPDLVSATILVFQPGCVYRETFLEWLADQGVQPARLQELGSVDAILGCARAGMGLALLPRRVVERSSVGAGLAMRALPDGRGRTVTCLIRRADQPLSAKLDILLESLRGGGEKETPGLSENRPSASPVLSPTCSRP